jgi:hypothetical protein
MSESPSKLIPALYGGIVIGLVSSIPYLNFVNCLCCAGVLLGGFLSVFFYTRDLTPDMPPLSSGDALQLGALAGVFGAVISSVVFTVVFELIGGSELMYEMETYSDQLPPEMFELMQNLVESGVVFFVIMMAASIIIDTLFGLLGGLIGYAVFKPKPTMTDVQPPMDSTV